VGTSGSREESGRKGGWWGEMGMKRDGRGGRREG